MDPQRLETAVSYEMGSLSIEPSQPDTPATLSAQSSMAALRAADPQEGVNVQELPPVDHGVRAWTFCFSGMILEMMVWGFGFRLALVTIFCVATKIWLLTWIFEQLRYLSRCATTCSRRYPMLNLSLLEYYSSHPPFQSASNVAIAAVGTVALGIQYGEVRALDCALALF